MGRIYEISFQNVSISATQDLFNIAATSGMAFALHEIQLGQITQTSVENLQISLRRFTATVTNGSGGGAATPQKHTSGDAAATVTARINDTVVATTNGTATVIRPDTFSLLNGYFYLPAPEDRIIIAPSQNLIIRLDSAPAAARTMSGSAVIEELF